MGAVVLLGLTPALPLARAGFDGGEARLGSVGPKGGVGTKGDSHRGTVTRIWPPGAPRRRRGQYKGPNAGISTTDPVFAAYLKAVRRHPRLTHPEQWKLLQAYRESKDEGAKQALIHCNLQLVVNMARRVARKWPRIGILDLIQEGNDGLGHACKKYNMTKYAGVEDDPREREYKTFAAYAANWIRAGMLLFVRDNWAIVKGGGTAEDKRAFFGVSKAQAAAMAKGDVPSLEDIARELGVPVGKLQRAAARMKGDVQLDHPSREDSDTPRMAFFRSNSSPIPHRQVEQANLVARVHEWLAAGISSSLPPMERRILTERLLKVHEPTTLQTIADAFDVTRERVRQREVKLLTRLRGSAEKNLGSAEDLLN